MNLKKLKKNIHCIRQLLSHPPHLLYVSGWNNHNNLGDEVLYSALKKCFYKYSFVDCPKGISNIFSGYIKNINVALLAGGTTIGGKLSNALHSRNFLGGCRKKIIFGSGVNNPDFWSEKIGIGEWNQSAGIWKEMLKNCDYIGVRGPDSAEILRQWGIEKVEILGDPIIIYAEDSIHPNIPDNRPSIGLNITETKGFIYGNQDDYLREFTNLAKKLKEAGYDIHWYVLWPNDYPLTKTAAESSGTSERIHQIYSNHDEFLEKVRQHFVFIGTRLHSVALSTVAYVPSISIEYQPKCSDYMKSIQQDKFIVRSDRLKSGLVWDMLTQIKNDRKTIVDSLYLTITQLKEKQLNTSKILLNKLEK